MNRSEAFAHLQRDLSMTREALEVIRATNPLRPLGVDSSPLSSNHQGAPKVDGIAQDPAATAAGTVGRNPARGERPLGVIESEAKRGESGTVEKLILSPTENETESVSAPTSPRVCGEYGLIRDDDDPNAEGDHHRCALDAGHAGKCRCHCNQTFTPWTSEFAPSKRAL